MSATFRGRPKDWLAHLALTETWTNRLFADARFTRELAPYLSCLGVDAKHARLAARKAVEILIAKDAFQRALDPDAPIAAECPQWLAKVEPSVKTIPAPGRLRLAAKVFAYLSYVKLRVLDPKWTNGPAPRSAFLFDQYYDHLDDQEFLAFYRYFKTRDDVVYSLPNELGGKYLKIQSDLKPAVVHRWTVPLRRKPAELARLARLSWLCAADRSMPVGFKLAMVKLFKDRLRYESLLDAFPCRRFMRVRFDNDAAHPLVTALQDARGGKHTGFPSGSYYRTYWYETLDFHEYGLLGRGFLEETYAGAWPKDARYEVLGPFTVELGETAPQPKKGKPVIGFFRTSYDDNFMIQRPLFERMLEAAATTAAACGASLLFKEKDRCIDDPHGIEKACREKDVPFEIAYNETLRAPDALASCDLAVAMSVSTLAWEALAVGRKVLVFEDPELTHPFESVEPRLVVRDAESLEKAAKWLLAMPQAEYDMLVAPLIARWAKRHDGRLVQDFIESLEHHG